MQEDDVQKDDLEESVHELMDEFDIDEKQAHRVEKLEDEGYDEEDAVSQAVEDVE